MPCDVTCSPVDGTRWNLFVGGHVELNLVFNNCDQGGDQGGDLGGPLHVWYFGNTIVHKLMTAEIVRGATPTGVPKCNSAWRKVS